MSAIAGILVVWASLARGQTADKGMGVIPLHTFEPAGYGNQYAQSFGVFVGINEFTGDKGIVPLRYAAADARAIHKCFVEELGYLPLAQARLLVTGATGSDRPTRANILRAVKEAADRAGPDGCVIVYLSTHGLEGSILAEDSHRSVLEDTAVSLDSLEKYLSGSRSPRRLLIFDACREQVTRDNKGVADGMSKAFASAFGQAKGFLVLKSCSADQVSYENEALGHGGFTACLLEGLRGAAPANDAGMITVTSLAPWLQHRVAAWSRGFPHGVQTPTFDLREASGDLPLAASREAVQSVARERRNALLRKAAEWLATKKLSEAQFQAVATALRTEDPEALATVEDIFAGNLPPKYVQAVLAPRSQAPASGAAPGILPGATTVVRLTSGDWVAAVERLFEDAVACLGDAPDDDYPRQMAGWRQLADTIGVSQVDGVVFSSRPSGAATTEFAVTLDYGQAAVPAPFWQGLAVPTRDYADVQSLLPGNTMAFFCISLDAGRLADACHALSASGLPGFADGWQGFQQALATDGWPLRRVLDNFDGTLGAAMMVNAPTQGETGPQEPQMAFFFASAQGQLGEMMTRRRQREGWGQREWKYQGSQWRSTFYLKNPEHVDITWGQLGSYLVLASSEELARQITDTWAGVQPGLAANSDYRQARAALPAAMTALAYVSPRLTPLLRMAWWQNMSGYKYRIPADSLSRTGHDWEYSLALSATAGSEQLELRGRLLLANDSARQAHRYPLALIADDVLLPFTYRALAERRLSFVATRLKEVGLALRMFCGDHDGRLPDPDMCAGLRALVDGGYMSRDTIWADPRDRLRMQRADYAKRQHKETLTEELTSFVYFGAGLKDDRNAASRLPVAFTKPGLPDPAVVLFMDGHVELLPGSYGTCAETMDAALKRWHSPPAMQSLLRQKAAQADAVLKALAR